MLIWPAIGAGSAYAQDEMCFQETGFCINGRFREYWTQNGGLAVFGFPIGPAQAERNRDTGQMYLMQRFERHRFEYHPENQPPYDVLLGRLGDDRLRQLGRDWRADGREDGPAAGCRWVPATGHNVCNQAGASGFRTYWETHGLEFDGQSGVSESESLALFGLPLTAAQTETNANGDTVLTQWFERARFEWHPDQPDEFRVLLGLLGREVGTGSVVLVGAGDIASCTSSGDEATALLLDRIPGIVFTLGDNAYESGTTAEYSACYDPSWGRHKARTRPSPGNHEYFTPGAAGYYAYFGAAAGDPERGYYSYDAGAWHVVVLNSHCAAIGGCDRGSPQEQWLRADLRAHSAHCTLAYWHRPRFSSGLGDRPTLEPFWDALYEAGADVVVNGHAHSYERYAPQTPRGEQDPERGIREFVVGTGGAGLDPITETAANSEVHNDDTYGVLKLTLRLTAYDWEFIPVPGQTFADTGSAPCH